MRWLLIAAPILLGGGGLTLLSLAPNSDPAASVGASADGPLASVLAATVTCPGEIHWPPVVLSDPSNQGHGAALEEAPAVSVVRGHLAGQAPSTAGLTLRVVDGSGAEVQAELVNPACVPDASAAVRPFIEAAWSSWTRPCSGCEWTAREGASVVVGTVRAKAGRESMNAVLALGFDGCGDTNSGPEATASSSLSAGTVTPQPSVGSTAERPASTSTPTDIRPPDTPPPSRPATTADAGRPTSSPPATTASAGAVATAINSPSPSPTLACGATETPAAGPTASPTAGSTETLPPPSPTQSSTPSVDLTIDSYTARVARGDAASITVTGPPGTVCEIQYRTPAGSVSKATGLSPVTLAADGSGSWGWNVSSRTSPGTGSITVTCGEATVTVPVEIA